MGTSNGAITDIDGNFSIQGKVGSTLSVTYVGYAPLQVKVTKQEGNKLVMKEDAKVLDEVVVVGMDTQKRNTITAAVATLKDDAIVNRPVTDVTSALQGNIAGLNFASDAVGGGVGGEIGADIKFSIRGIGSINASSAPLYVLDGVPFDGSINTINPEDIASLTVLKDSASDALYGSRGANGVIIITTKQGHTDSKTTVSINASFGGSNRAIRDYDRVGTNQYFELYWEALRNQYALNSDKYTPQTAAAQASKDLVGKLMGGAPNPYGPNYPQPVGTDGKLLAGATPLWNVDWQKEMEQ